VITILLTAICVLSALALIFLILLHSGRGGGLSDMFGGGQLGGSMAGSTVVERNLDRLTIIVALVFIFATVILALDVAP
jgi:preprotein translocase subunit SecG